MAIKVVPHQRLNTPRLKEALAAEVAILKQVRHDNIVALYESVVRACPRRLCVHTRATRCER